MYYIICCLDCDVIYFEINHINPYDFPYQTILLYNQQWGQKCKSLKNEKSFWNKKCFSSVLKGFQLSEIVSDPRVGLQDDYQYQQCLQSDATVGRNWRFCYDNKSFISCWKYLFVAWKLPRLQMTIRINISHVLKSLENTAKGISEGGCF